MKKSIPLIIAITFSVLLVSVIVVSFMEQKSMKDAIRQLEQVESANLIVVKDSLGAELLRYEATGANTHTDRLLLTSTFDKSYHSMIKNALTGLHGTIEFYDEESLLGVYQLFRLDEDMLDKDIQEKIVFVDQVPCLIVFRDRYWTLGKDLKNIQWRQDA